MSLQTEYGTPLSSYSMSNKSNKNGRADAEITQIAASRSGIFMLIVSVSLTRMKERYAVR
jgi:hypothetical protein